MLFLLDSAGVPSKAQFIQLSRFGTAPPLGAIASPATDLTIPAGCSVSFGTATAAAKYSWVFPGGTPTTSTAQTPGNVTFNTPGRYTTSLTVIDAVGNSDPSPPTRTVTVTPSTPDFHISVSPSGRLVNPGQSTTFTVSVTPVSGFTGPVTLDVSSESAFPSGVTSGGFSPSTITGSGSSTLTMNTTGSAVPYALSLTVTGTSGTLTHTTSTTLMVTLAAPATLSATPGSGQVSLSWATSAGASGYQVKRSTVSGGPYVVVGCSAGTSFIDTGLTNGTTYHYVVSATYTGGPVAGGASANSSQASATPQAPPPQPPTGLVATPGNAQVSLSWTASSGATSYNVKRSTVSGGPYTTVAQHRRDELHQYRAHQRHDLLLRGHRGERGRGERELHAGERHASRRRTGSSDGRLGDAWQRPGLAELDRLVRRDELQREALDRVTGGRTPRSAAPARRATPTPGSTNGTTYFYVVTAVNASGESGNSTQVSATPQSVAPAPPTQLTATRNKPGRLTLHWVQSPTPGVTSNGIYRRTDPGTYPANPVDTIPANTVYQDNGLSGGTTYCYRVTAISGAGSSAPSNESCGSPK